MKTVLPDIRWRRLPRALWLAYPAQIALLGFCVVLAIAAAGRYVIRHAPRFGATATSITPITNLAAPSSGIVYSGEAYNVACTVSGTATLYPAVYSNSAWQVFQGYPCPLDSSVATQGTCAFPAGFGSGVWNAYKTGGGSVSSCTASPRTGPVPAVPRSGGGSSGSGTVTSISQGAGMLLTPNPITTTGTVALPTVGPGAGTYGGTGGEFVESVTLDAYGRVTAVSAAIPNTRVPTDADDVLVWYNGTAAPLTQDSYEFALPFASTGTNTEPLTAMVGQVWYYGGIGPYGDAWITPYSISNGFTGGVLRTQDVTTAGELQTMTVSSWVYIQSLPNSPVFCGLVGKRNVNGAWASPYTTWQWYVGSDASGIVEVHLDDGSVVDIQTDSDVLLPGLHFIGFTINQTNHELIVYVDGVVAPGTVATDVLHDLDYFADGPYQIGGFLQTPTSAFYSGGWADDIRIADVVRDAAWFAEVWSTRQVPSSLRQRSKHHWN